MEAQPDLDLGRVALHPRRAGRLRDRRCRHPLLDRLPAHQRADLTQAQLLFARALEDQELLDHDGLTAGAAEDGLPVLVAWSDNGAEMTAIDTRTVHGADGDHPASRPARHPDRPGAHRELLQPSERRLAASHQITDPAVPRCRARPDPHPSTTPSACTPRSGTSPPMTSITAAAPSIRRARAAGLERARVERIKQNRASKT